LRQPFITTNRLRAAAQGALASALIAAQGLAAPAFAQAPDSSARSCLQLVEMLATDGRVALDGVSFDFNRATLRPDSQPALLAARDAILTLGGDWQIAGHTDNIGSRDYNQTLSEQRALAVRDWLVGAGVAADKLSAAGFSFDAPIADNSTDAGRAQNRRVELVGSVDPDMLGFGGPAGADPCPDTLVAGTQDDVTPPPPITSWTGNGGQEWLPFSYLMPTGDGGDTGWSGDSLTMAPGTQPQACQALCAANDDCGAFSFSPAGAFFVQTATCYLFGYGTELNLVRDNVWLDGGIFFASGLKPDATNLTPDSGAIAEQILADMAEIAQLQQTARLTAPDSHPAESWMQITLTGFVPPADYATFVEIADLDDYGFDWSKSKSSINVDMLDPAGQGQIWVPEPGDYLLRYMIQHPTAGSQTILSQLLHVTGADGGTANSDRTSTFEPGIDRPGMDLARTVIGDAPPEVCQALCADDAACQAWTYVNPGLQDTGAVCWTKSDVPTGFDNDCCTSGVMQEASAPSTDGTATLSFPMVVVPGETIPVTYTGPLYSGDWIDIVAAGDADDMSGGFGWDWATGAPVTLTAPAEEGEYDLRYVAEHPDQGRIVLAQDVLVVRAGAAAETIPADILHRCEGAGMTPCEIILPDFDIALTLMPGYGLTEPFYYETAAGVVADRPSFDIARISDGTIVLTVNARQVMAPYCQDSLAGDQICLTNDMGEDDGFMAAFVFGSLNSAAAALEAQNLVEDEPGIAPGILQGIWFAQALRPGTSDDQSYFMVVELYQDEGDSAVYGQFTAHPEIGPLPGITGDITGQQVDEDLTLTFATADGTALMVFTGTASGGGIDYFGDLELASGQGDAYGTRLLLQAGPGEDWSGPGWMTGDPDGMEAAMLMGQATIADLMGDLDGDDQAMAEIMGALMGAFAGSGGDSAPPLASPNLQGLNAQPVDLQGIPAEAMMELILPFQEIAE
jgi:outer membrane protein OmpA-like peptidoglycan-associated protein